MCGIVGIINNEKMAYNSRELFKFFKEALLCDSLRGMHGTGVLGVTNKGEENLYKKPINAYDFIDLSRTKKIIEDTDNVFLIGHNRWATTGAHTIDNSHPFTHRDITLFHNGSLSGGYRLLSKETFSVDSEYICHALSEAYNPSDILEKLDGSYSLVWYNSDLQTLNFARNEDRPMSFAKVKGSNSYLFGSEYKMIEWLAGRNGIKIDDPWSLKPGVLLSIPLDGEKKHHTSTFKIKEDIQVGYYYQNKGSSSNFNFSTTRAKTEEEKRIDFEYVEVTPTSFVQYENSLSGYLECPYKDDFIVKIVGTKEHFVHNIGNTIKVKLSSYNVKDKTYYGALYVEKNKGVVVIENKANNSVIPIDSSRKNSMSFKEFKRKTKNGCSMCTEDLAWEKRNDIKWTVNDEPLCSDCYEYYSEGSVGV